MKNKKMLTITLILITIHLLFLSSCSISSGNSGYSKSKAKKAVKAVEDGGEQRYALPLATANPEDKFYMNFLVIYCRNDIKFTH